MTVAFLNTSVRRFFLVLLFALFCTSVLSVYLPGIVYANGHSPAGESKKAESAKPASKKPANKTGSSVKKTTATKTTAQKKIVVKKSTAAKKNVVINTADKDAPLHQGRTLVEEGRYRTAVNVLRSYLKANPRSVGGWYWISRAHHALGDYDRAQIAANIVLQIDPYYPALTKTPSGLEPIPKKDRRSRVEPYPSRSVLPVKQPIPSKLPLEPITISFPLLVVSGDKSVSGDNFVNPENWDTASLHYIPYPPLPVGETVVWMQDERFMEISRWRLRVDRMAMLENPRVPVAWKGMYPYEVYFWTGSQWARVRKNPEKFDYVERYDDILFRAKEAIEKLLREENFHWFERDTPAFAAAASAMHYLWLGDIKLDGAKARAGERKWNELVVEPSTLFDQKMNEK